MIRQLLALARLESNNAPDQTHTDLVALVRECLSAHDPAARIRQIELEYAGPDVFRESADLNALRCILDNLIDNAIRYGNDGGRVRVELDTGDGNYTVAVEDDGPGISTAERDKVFERFYRGRSVTAMGTGLGLSIVKRAAARLGGTIQLTEGSGGSGCRFTLRVRSRGDV